MEFSSPKFLGRSVSGPACEDEYHQAESIVPAVAYMEYGLPAAVFGIIDVQFLKPTMDIINRNDSHCGSKHVFRFVWLGPARPGCAKSRMIQERLSQ